MAEFFTLGQIKRKVQVDTDLEAEDFVQDEELVGYINEGIDEAETHIHTLGLEDDYFLSYFSMLWTAGNDLFDLPTDIYANKIRGITYDDGSLIYAIKRVRGMHYFNKIANAQHFSNSDDYYQYALVNRTKGAGSKMLIFPKSRINSTSTDDGSDGLPLVRMWYLRQANRLSADEDVCDIPDFFQFIVAYAQWKVFFKEGHPNMGSARINMEEQRNIMIDTLAQMVPDKDTEIVPDLDMYTDIS